MAGFQRKIISSIGLVGSNCSIDKITIKIGRCHKERDHANGWTQQETIMNNEFAMGGHRGRLTQITVSRHLKWDAAFRALDVREPITRASRSRCSLQPGLSHGGLSARKRGGIKVRNVIAWGEAYSAQPQADGCLWNLLRPVQGRNSCFIKSPSPRWDDRKVHPK